MSGLRTIALMEAERLALVEALNAMTQLADVRERMYSEEHDETGELYRQVLAAEKLHEQAVDKGDEHLALLRERNLEHQNELGKRDAREKRVLEAFERFVSGMHPDHVRHGRSLMNAALAEEIPF